jgi:monoamine oxidase
LLLGASGLYAGILLAQSGHTVTIYEASDRAGGRIFTYRDPKNPSLYIGEFGAMRFPLEVHPNLNTLLRQRYNHKLNITEFYNWNDNAYLFLNGIFATMKQARENPDIFQFNTSESERGKVRFKSHKKIANEIDSRLLTNYGLMLYNLYFRR